MVIVYVTRNLDQYQKTLDYTRSTFVEGIKYLIIPPVEAHGEVLLQDGRIESPSTAEKGLQETLYETVVNLPEDKILFVPEGRFVSSEFFERDLSKTLFYEEEGESWGALVEKGELFPTGKRHYDWINLKSLELSREDFSLFPRIESLQKKAALPRILVFGDENVQLKSIPPQGAYESDELEVFSFYTSRNAKKLIFELDPDVILTLGESYKLYPELERLPSWLKHRWIHENKLNEMTGQRCYEHSLYIMTQKANEYPLISIITPVRNIGEKLRQTYDSVAAQTWWNWEWILVNDGDDEITDQIAKEIAAQEPRVKYYDIKPRSQNRVGEAKFRAFSLSEGDFLVELDHDDMLTPEAIELVALSFEKYPDAGFCYSNYAEVDVNFNDLSYGGDSFAYGYGLYTSFYREGRYHTEQHTPHINPVSIRSNVAMPNHLRAWRRSTYFESGGHSRRMSVMDDLDIIIRTFLHTKIVKIDWMCYWQFYFGLFYNQSSITNTQNLVRLDIQRRARTLCGIYNERIRNRFEKDFDLVDWAYEQNPEDPRSISPVHGSGENRVNYVLDRETIEKHLYYRGLKSVYKS